MKRVKPLAGALLVTLVVGGGPAAAQAPAVPGRVSGAPADPTSDPAPEVSVPITDADLRRIKKALGSEPAFTITDDQLRFYVQVLAKQQTFADFVKGYDLMNGPTRRGNPMTHQEFLNIVTPKELHSSGGITASEMLQFAVTNWLGQTLVRRAIDELRNAKTEREVREIRERISRELAALKGG